MQPVDISNRTRAIGAPLNWDETLDGRVGVLCVRDDVDLQSGARTMTSLWKPDASEIMFLQRGLPLKLTIFGIDHPVVSVGIAEPADVPEKEKPL